MDIFLSITEDKQETPVGGSVIFKSSSNSPKEPSCSPTPRTIFSIINLFTILIWIGLLASSVIATGNESQQDLTTYSENFSLPVITNSSVDDGEHTSLKRSATGAQPNANQSSRASMILKPEHFSIPVGGVIHLFPRYGYFHLSMKVIAKTDKIANNSSHAPTSSSPSSSSSSATLLNNESWIFLEPINNVLDSSTFKIEETTISPSSDNHSSLPFHNLFHIDLCEDIRELMEAYFKNFSVEGLDKPWQAFSGGWRVPSIARYFGVDQNYVEGDYRYILVKVLLVRGTGTVIPMMNATVSSTYHPNFQRFQPNNDLSTYEFFKVVGTHYIHAYIVGNAVYQVFVYDPDGFQTVKKRLFYDGIRPQSTSGFMEKLPELLTQWVKQTGKVFVLSSTPEVLETVRHALVMKTAHTGSTSNLFKLHNNSELVHQVEKILAGQPNAVLGIDLRGIHFLFRDSFQRAGFEKALKHKLQLWEINFQY